VETDVELFCLFVVVFFVVVFWFWFFPLIFCVENMTPCSKLLVSLLQSSLHVWKIAEGNISNTSCYMIQNSSFLILIKWSWNNCGVSLQLLGIDSGITCSWSYSDPNLFILSNAHHILCKSAPSALANGWTQAFESTLFCFNYAACCIRTYQTRGLQQSYNCCLIYVSLSMNAVHFMGYSRTFLVLTFKIPAPVLFGQLCINEEKTNYPW